MSKIEVRQVGLDKVTPQSGVNPMDHPKEQIDQLATSIRQYGFTQPVLVNKKNQIVAGHARYAAAKKLHLKTIPIIVVETLTDDQREMAYMVADNKIPRGAQWNAKKLKKILDDLGEAGLNVEDMTGFTSDDVSRLADDLYQSTLRNMAGGDEDGVDRLNREITARAERAAATGSGGGGSTGYVTFTVTMSVKQRDFVTKFLSDRKTAKQSMGDALYQLCKST